MLAEGDIDFGGGESNLLKYWDSVLYKFGIAHELKCVLIDHTMYRNA